MTPKTACSGSGGIFLSVSYLPFSSQNLMSFIGFYLQIHQFEKRLCRLHMHPIQLHSKLKTQMASKLSFKPRQYLFFANTLLNLSLIQPTFINKPIIIAFTVDLSSTGQSAACSLLAYNLFFNPSPKTSLSYGSDWAFDPSTIISLCGNPDGTNQYECDIQNFKVSSIVPALFPIISLSNKRNHQLTPKFLSIMHFRDTPR